MKIRLWHRLGVAFLLAFSASSLTNCSDDQQVQEAIEQGEQGQGYEEGEGNYAGEGGDYEGEGNYGAAGDEVAAAVPDQGGQQDELQEIIDGMNSQPIEGEQLTQVAPIEEPPLNANPVPEATPELQQQAAVGMAAAPGLPELGSKMSYVIKRGDTLASVATKIYGDMEKWREIAEFTGMANPNMIYPGDVIYYQLTDQTMAFAAAYESVKRSQVVVQPGDTLSTISSRVLGRSNDWKMIWRQNDNIDNPDRLVVGQTLYYVDPGMLMSALDKSGAEQLKSTVAIVSQPQPTIDSQVQPDDVAAESELVNSSEDEFRSDFASLETVGYSVI